MKLFTILLIQISIKISWNCQTLVQTGIDLVTSPVDKEIKIKNPLDLLVCLPKSSNNCGKAVEFIYVNNVTVNCYDRVYLLIFSNLL